LEVYIKYKPEDVGASMQFGKLLFDMGEYEQTVQMMDRVIAIERTRRDAYLYRLLSNVELGKAAEADSDFSAVQNFYPDLFEANLGLLRSQILNERYGSAEQAITKTEELAETDEQKALIYYWAAIVYEKRENSKKAAEYWQLLLDLPEKAMTTDMRKQAEEHLLALATPTSSAKPSATKPVTPTKQVTPTRTPTAAPKTPTPTPTK
jgi:tetratricopeptide (TPR) repeat protein